MGSECEVLLYLAARAQHVREKIVPALEQGTVVVCDRFQFATFAYQGYGRGLPLAELQRMNAFATSAVDPDLTFIFDIPVEMALRRLAAMNKQADRLEAGGREFFERIRSGYKALAAESPDRSIILDGSRSIESLAAEIYSRVVEKLNGCAF
jgi:dTMP kinase